MVHPPGACIDLTCWEWILNENLKTGRGGEGAGPLWITFPTPARLTGQVDSDKPRRVVVPFFRPYPLSRKRAIGERQLGAQPFLCRFFLRIPPVLYFAGRKLPPREFLAEVPMFSRSCLALILTLAAAFVPQAILQTPATRTSTTTGRRDWPWVWGVTPFEVADASQGLMTISVPPSESST